MTTNVKISLTIESIDNANAHDPKLVDIAVAFLANELNARPSESGFTRGVVRSQERGLTIHFAIESETPAEALYGSDGQILFPVIDLENMPMELADLPSPIAAMNLLVSKLGTDVLMAALDDERLESTQIVAHVHRLTGHYNVETVDSFVIPELERRGVLQAPIHQVA